MQTRKSVSGWEWLTAMAAVVLIGLLPLGSARAESIPALPEISPAAAYPDLVTRRVILVGERTVLRDRTQQHNGMCHSVVAESPEAAHCETARAALAADVNRHIEASNQFIANVERARIITSMNTLAARLGWTADERARLDKALNRLGFDGEPDVTRTQIRHAWQDILARRQGDWRSAADRANPQHVIEQKGLTGGEMIMLAEAFGQAEVVPSSAFAKTLKQGRPVMVNVVPQDGNFDGGHEVVLTRAFQHDGAPWYEMMDSHQGPQRRLYVNAQELITMLKENGVAFRPESGTVPTLLR